MGHSGIITQDVRYISGKRVRKSPPFSRYTALVILLLTLVLVIAGCSSQPTVTSTPTPTPTPSPTITFNPEVILATTTSTADTGLLDAILPIFEQKTGYKVKPIAVGSGQAMTMGERGEADVLLVHAPLLEAAFMQNNNGINRKLVMHNNFAILGPPADPAGIKGMTVSSEAFKKIADKQALYLSRGTNSGTDEAEQNIWKVAGINPAGQSWYQQSGQGMGATLTIASEKGAYILTDWGTYLKTQKNLSLSVMVEGDKSGILLNIYHVIEVNPQKSDKINSAGAKAFSDFIISPEIQKFISTFGADKYGQPFFLPDAGKNEAEVGK